MKKIILIFSILLISATCFADWQQVYKVIPDTTTWQYEWRYRGQIGVGNDTTTVNAFMRWDGLIQGTTIYATDYFKCPDGTVFTSTSAFGGGGGSSTFLGLTDTPAAFDSGKYFKSWTSSGTWETPAGAGDMEKADYDVDANDIVDNAEEVGSLTTAGIVLRTGTTTYTTITDNSSDWDSAYGWGDHSIEGYITETDSGVVTFENLQTNDDVGSGNSQVAYGTHTHTGVYEPADATIMKEAENISLLTNDSGYKVYTDSISYSVDSDKLDNHHWSEISSVIVDTATYSITSSTSTYAESVNYNVLVSSADYAPGDNLGNHTATQDIDASGYKVTSSSLTVTNNATVGSLSSSGQVTSNGRKVTDTIELDCFYIIGSTATAGTTPVRISAYRDYAITITTMTVKAFGGTNCVGMIEQRARSADGSAGTDIWSGDATILTTGYIGGTVADFTVPANYALWFKPTSWTGAVTALSFDGVGTKD